MDRTRAQHCASINDVEAARERIADYVHRTPVLTCTSIDAIAGRTLAFKAELFQKTGSFKIRGALNAVLQLSPEAAKRGVITHSSGNHGAALAAAAAMRGVPATVIVPRTTPTCKQDAIRAYGAELLHCEPTMDAREAACAAVMSRTGATLIPPYNDAAVIAGQGTIALELLDQIGELASPPQQLDAVVVPVSGGGMISGIATTIRAMAPECVVVAAEPSGRNDAADVAAAKEKGELVQMPKPDTIADGLQGRLGDCTWAIMRDKVDGVVVVSEEDIVQAMRLIFERMKVVVEPSGAAGLAAVLTPAFAARYGGCKRVGVILCGGNVDLDGYGLYAALLGH